MKYFNKIREPGIKRKNTKIKRFENKVWSNTQKINMKIMFLFIYLGTYLKTELYKIKNFKWQVQHAKKLINYFAKHSVGKMLLVLANALKLYLFCPGK